MPKSRIVDPIGNETQPRGPGPRLTTIHLVAMVAYFAGLFAILAPLARTHKAADAWFLSALVVVAASPLVGGLVWLFEQPGPGRTNHLILVAALGRITRAAALVVAAVGLWVVRPADDLAFFLRVEGLRWLAWRVVAPVVLALAAVALVGVIRWRLASRRGRAGPSFPGGAVHRLVAFATFFAAPVLGLWWLAPLVLDRQLVVLTRLLLSAGLLALAWRMRPRRCPACGRPALVPTPRRPPFVAEGEPDEPAWCLSCGAECRRPQDRRWRVRASGD